jgi:hypothetical protein
MKEGWMLCKTSDASEYILLGEDKEEKLNVNGNEEFWKIYNPSNLEEG